MNSADTNATEQGTLDSTRRAASQALERAGERLREMRTGMRDIAGRGVSSVSEGAHAAQQRLGDYASATTRYVSERPLKSALIAAAVGAAVAGIIIAVRHQRSRRYF